MKKLLVISWIIIPVTVIITITVLLIRLPQEIINLVGFACVASFLIAIAGAFIYAGKMFQQRYKSVAYDTKRKKYEIIKDGFGMVHLINLDTDIVENLSTYPGTHHNGIWVEPHPAAAAAWFALVGKARSESPANLLLPASVDAEYQPELLALINQYPHVHIFGRTGNGKTSLLRTIGHNRIAGGHKVFVLDSNDHPAEWIGLTRIKDEREQDEFINRALSVHRLNSEALADGRAIEADFEQITILSNEWTDIVKRTEAAAIFIDEMSRKSRKSGFHCGFSTQTKLAADLGLDGRYQVVRNFLQVELLQTPDGIHTAKCYADNRFVVEVTVPTPPPKPAALSSGYLPPDIDIVDAVAIEAKTTEKQQAILNNYDNGLTDEREIARIVYGEPGGKQVELVKKTLAKYQRTTY